jgi:NAD+ diphosphatase
MPFVPGLKPSSKATEPGWWFLFHEQRLLVKRDGDSYVLPQTPDLKELKAGPLRKEFFGSLDNHPCYFAHIQAVEDFSAPFRFIGLRDFFVSSDEDLIQTAGMANQLAYWNQNHRYCGKCGTLTENKTNERAKICPQCGLTAYPRLSPAIIVAVLKDRQILLAHSPRFPAKFYSVLAGFVEPGETLEACVRREILEEVGIAVKNISYFGSQPWPFPDSLMIGFTATYAGGEIRIDGSEIADAGWFTADNLPAIPPRISIARKLIDWFLENSRSFKG